MKYATLGLVVLMALFAGVAYSGQAVKAADEFRLRATLSDPVVGYLSDRTRSQYGRRRVWMLGGILPTGALFYVIFSQPDGLSDGMLISGKRQGMLGR